MRKCNQKKGLKLIFEKNNNNIARTFIASSRNVTMNIPLEMYMKLKIERLKNRSINRVGKTSQTWDQFTKTNKKKQNSFQIGYK